MFEKRVDIVEFVKMVLASVAVVMVRAAVSLRTHKHPPVVSFEPFPDGCALGLSARARFRDREYGTMVDRSRLDAGEDVDRIRFGEDSDSVD